MDSTNALSRSRCRERQLNQKKTFIINLCQNTVRVRFFWDNVIPQMTFKGHWRWHNSIGHTFYLRSRITMCLSCIVSEIFNRSTSNNGVPVKSVLVVIQGNWKWHHLIYYHMTSYQSFTCKHSFTLYHFRDIWCWRISWPWNQV